MVAPSPIHGIDADSQRALRLADRPSPIRRIDANEFTGAGMKIHAGTAASNR